jgi:hypothetical protein
MSVLFHGTPHRVFRPKLAGAGPGGAVYRRGEPSMSKNGKKVVARPGPWLSEDQRPAGKVMDLDALVPAKEPFSDFDQRTIIQMMIRPSLQKFVEPVVKYLDIDMFPSAAEKAVLLELLEYHEKYGVLPSVQHLQSTQGEVRANILDKYTTDDPVGFGVQALLASEPNPGDVVGVRSRLYDWVDHQRWLKVVGSEEAIVAVMNRDKDTLRQLIAEAESPLDGERLLGHRVLSQPAFVTEDDPTTHMRLTLGSLQQSFNDGGPAKGEVICYMARTGGFKSWMCCNDAVTNALAGHKTFGLSLEITLKKWVRRCAGILTGLHTSHLKQHPGLVNSIFADRLRDLKGDDTLVVQHRPRHTISVATLKAMLARERDAGFCPEVVVVDYLELLLPRRKSRRDESEYERQKETAHDLCAFAQEEDVLVITCTQANRKGAANGVKLDMGMMAESFGKAMGLDYIVAIETSDEEKELGVQDARGKFHRPAFRVNTLKVRDGYEVSLTCAFGPGMKATELDCTKSALDPDQAARFATTP